MSRASTLVRLPVGLSGDASGNIGLGITSNAWAGGNTALQMAGPSMWGASGVSHWSTNTYFDGSNYKYIATGPVIDYYQYNGAHVLRASDSGSSGANVTTFANLISVAKGQTLALQGASSQSGTGISFPVDQNASADARTLDDYEEGTWTPIITGSGGNPTVTYTTQRGNYVKVGRLVFASFYISISSFSGGSGRGNVGGLPFVASSVGAGAPDDNGGSIQEHNAMLSYPAGRTWVTMYVVNGGTNAPLAANGSGIGGADMTIGTNLVSTSGGYILGAVTYTSA